MIHPKAQRLWTIAGLCAVCTLLFGVLTAIQYHRIIEFETYTEDLRLQFGRRAPIDERLAFIGISQQSYENSFGEEERKADPGLDMICGQWPWSREVWALVIERLLSAGARVVALDIIFQSQGHGDERLREVLDKYRNRVVIGAHVMQSEMDRGTSTTALMLPNNSVIQITNAHPMQDVRIGYVSLEPEVGHTIRSIAFRTRGDLVSVLPEGVEAESFTARILRQGGHTDKIPENGYERVRFRYSAPPNEGYRMIPLPTVVVERYWKAFTATNNLTGKMIVVGPADTVFHDEHRTPFHQNMLGPEIHLNILAAALNHEFLERGSTFTNLAVTLWAGLVAWLLAWRFTRLFQRFVVVLLCGILFALVAQLLYNHASLFIATVSPLLTLVGSSTLGLVYDFALLRREKVQLRRTLERYVAKDVVRELLDNPQTYLNSLTGVRKPVTILFSDVRGFTTLTEGANETLLVKQLNEYFQEMVTIVVNNRGRLDKFIGDAVMADWGSFVTGGPPLDAERAIQSALEMRIALERLNKKWATENIKTLAFGIGINHGEVIVGNLGSEEKMEVSVIGDPVNLASRLEGLTKEYQIDLLIGEGAVNLAKGRFPFRTVDLVRVKGKTKPVEVFTIPSGLGAGDATPAWLKSYEQAVTLYRSRRFAEALLLLEESAKAAPEDVIVRIYIERCQTLIKEVPPAEWTGVFEAKHK